MMDWLMTPEIQTDPHHWWATFAGHAALGAAMWALMVAVGVERGLAFVMAMLGYFIWEFDQIALFGGDTVDAAVDWSAFTGGALFGWVVWAQRKAFVVPVLALIAMAGFAGAADAKKRKWGGGK